MVKRIFKTDKAPLPKGPYSQAVISQGLLFISGQGPIDPKTGKAIKGTIEEETKATLENIKAIIEEAGASLTDTLKTTCFLSSMDDFSRFNDIYKQYFHSEPRSRTTVQAARLPFDFKVEIDAIVSLKNKT